MDEISRTRVKWFRNTSDKKIAGICSGLSDMLDIDVTLIRFTFLMLCITPIPIITAYLAAWFIVPKKGDIHVGTSTSTSTVDSPNSKKEFLTESW